MLFGKLALKLGVLFYNFAMDDGSKAPSGPLCEVQQVGFNGDCNPGAFPEILQCPDLRRTYVNRLSIVVLIAKIFH